MTFLDQNLSILFMNNIDIYIWIYLRQFSTNIIHVSYMYTCSIRVHIHEIHKNYNSKSL